MDTVNQFVSALRAAALLAIVAGCQMPRTPAEQPTEQPTAPSEVTEPGASPALAIADVSAGEGDLQLTFTVTLGAAGAESVTAKYTTEDQTATAPADYQATGGALTFVDGTKTLRIAVPLHDDEVAEASETFTLRLSEPRGAALARAAATATIVDNDAPRVAVLPARLNVVEGATGYLTVVLGSEPTSPVTVSVAEAEELSATPDEVVFLPSDWLTRRTVRVSAAEDEDAQADPPVELTYAASGGGYDGVRAAVVVTIVENDVPTLAVTSAHAAENAGHLSFAVGLSLASDRAVTVQYTTGAPGDTAHAGEDYTRAADMLRFAPGSTAAQTIAVAVHDDTLDEATEQLTMTLSDPADAVLAGGGQTVAAAGTIEDDDPAPVLRVADGSVSEDGGAVEFAVQVAPASGQTVRVRYATADGTAVAGSDYTQTSGELTFAPGQGLARTVSVPVTNDNRAEPDEQFTVTLSAAVNATIDADGGTATGTIRDDEPTPEFTIADAAASEEDAAMHFMVRLDPASGQIARVAYATSDDTATAGADYTAASGTLTFTAGAAVRTIAVPLLADHDTEGDETFQVTLRDPQGAGLADKTATGSIIEPKLELQSLAVTGGGTMYPRFAADTLHYALTCRNNATLRVNAESARGRTTLKLLRAAANDDHVGTGLLDVRVRVQSDHDLAIELGDTDGTVTYVVHCVPAAFPAIHVLKKTAEVSGGLMFITPKRSSGVAGSYMAIVDNNGVPRFHRDGEGGRNFRSTGDGPLIDGKRVRYSIHKKHAITLYDADFNEIRTVRPVAPLRADRHDHLITPEGNFLFMSYHTVTRDLCQAPRTCPKQYTDSVIQEVTPQEVVEFEWNSWGHVNRADCGTGKDYAHLNSLQVIDGDIVASFRNCGLILRIDRASGSGAVVWQLGGTAPPPDTDTAVLEIVGDDDGRNEFCNQHHATLTADGTVVLFDNGVACRGARKANQFTRVVEYDISSGSTAEFVRDFRLPRKYGPTDVWGGATVLDSGRWLIAWNHSPGTTLNWNETIAVSEVDPETGTVHLHLHMSWNNAPVATYRVYRVAEEDVQIPLNLP